MDVKQQADNRAPSLDIGKWIAASLLLAVAVVGNTHFAEQPFLYRLIGIVVLMGLSISIALTTERGQKFISLAKDARAEVRRVVWPTKQETWTTSGIVVLAVVISALVLWLIDTALGALVSLLVG